VEVVDTDPDNDLALLRLRWKRTRQEPQYFLRVASSALVLPETEVIAIGQPKGSSPMAFVGSAAGFLQTYRWTQTRSGLLVPRHHKRTAVAKFDPMQTFPGCSGGPVLLPSGEVYSVMTGYFDDTVICVGAPPLALRTLLERNGIPRHPRPKFRPIFLG
jgi:S1-C subfamily serine protease